MLDCPPDDAPRLPLPMACPMTDDPMAVSAPRPSAFLTADTATNLHIVDALIQERCPTFADHWTWPVLRPVLYNMLGYRKARRMADELVQMNGTDSFNYLSTNLAFDLTLNAIDRVPKTGRLVIAANHPTGLADGIAMWDALMRVRKDIVFFANADAIRVNRRFEDVIIPVEWVMEKRSPAKTRETLRRAGEAFAAEKCIVIFPSGKLAKMMDGQLTEQEWFSTVIGLARKQKAPIVPVNVSARNSQLFYLFSKLNGELRDITLFHELLNKSGSKFDMTFGPTIAPGDLQGDPSALTTALRDYVAYVLRGNPGLTFAQSLSGS